MEITCKNTYFLGILLLLVGSYVVIGSEEDAETLPEILLEQYKVVESRSWEIISNESSFPDSLIKDGTDFSVSSNSSQTVSHILLSCRAPYPIYWAMADVKPTLSNQIKTDFKVVLDFEEEEVSGNSTDIEATEFWSYLILYNEVSFTGLYTCRSVEDENIQTGSYIFLPGMYDDSSRILLQAGENIMVGVNGQQSVVLPCKVSQSLARISIEKRGADGNWSSLSLRTKFDPKQGWTLNKDEVSPLTGQYKCTVAQEELVIDVLNEYVEDEKVFSLKNETSGANNSNWGYQMNGLYRRQIECCSNSTELPILIVVECDNMAQCNMKGEALVYLSTNETSKMFDVEELEPHWQSDSCVRTKKERYAQSFLIQCTGDGIDVSGQFVMEFSPPSYDNYKMTSIPFTTIQNISYSAQSAISTEFWRQDNLTDGTRLVNIDIFKTGLYSGEKLLIGCCGLQSFHAAGRIQRIGWENGTVTPIPSFAHQQIDNPDRPYVIDFFDTFYYDWDNYEDYLVTLEQNMSYYECIVPRWYTTYPGIKRIPLDVKESKEPIIFQNINANDEVDVIYSENQLGLLELKCEIYEGAPPPQLKWTKDGYELNQTDLYWSMVEASELAGWNVLFMRAIKEIEGRYECTITNWKGFDSRTFIVKITPRSYLDYWIALVVFGGFFAMIACCAVRISALEQKMTSKKQVDPINLMNSDEMPGIDLNKE